MEASKLKKSLTKQLTSYKWVTHPQRREVSDLLCVSRPTIDNYINGKLGKLEFAEKLLKVLRKIQKPKKLTV